MGSIQQNELIRNLLIEVRVYLKYGMPEEAESALIKATKLNPSLVAPHQLLLELYERIQDREKIISQLQTIARIHAKKKETNQAIFYYNKILEHDPSHVEAEEYIQKHKPATDTDVDEKKVEKEPDTSQKLWESEEKIVLKEFFDDLMDVSPGEEEEEEKGETPLTKGIQEMKKGKITEAISLFQQAVRATGLEADACLLLGHCFQKENHLSLAIRNYKKGLSLPDKEPGFYRELKYSLALCLEKMGKLKEALKYFKEVASEDPTYRDVPTRLKKLKGELQ